jgi:hypothetical protein
MGAKASKEVTNAMEVVNAFAINAIVENSASSTGAVTGTQTQVNRIGKGCNITNSNFTQLANLNINLASEIQTEQSNKVAQQIANDIATQLEQKTDRIAQGIAAVFNPGGRTNDKTTNMTTIKNEVKALFSQKTLQTLVGTIKASQIQKNLCAGGTVSGTTFLQQFNANVVTNMRQKSTQYNDFVNKAITNAKQNLSDDDGSDIGKALRSFTPGGLVGALLSPMTNPTAQGGSSWGNNLMYMSASSVSCVCCIGMLALLGVAVKKGMI